MAIKAMVLKGMVLLSALSLLSGCANNGGTMTLIGEENCIICIERIGSKNAANRNSARERYIPEELRKTPEYYVDGPDGLTESKPVTSRYGELFVAQLEDPNNGPREFLFFNNQPIFDSMTSVGYSEDNNEDIIGNYLLFDQPVQMGEYDFLSLRTFSGGQGQRKFAYYLIVIGPDQLPYAFGHDDMFSGHYESQVKDGQLVADYDRTTVFSDGKTFKLKRKAMNQVPDRICRGLYENRAEYAQSLREYGEFSGLSQAIKDWPLSAEEYSQFKPQALLKSAGKVSYATFKQRVCD